jgi:hypothetical protein
VALSPKTPSFGDEEQTEILIITETEHELE